MSDILNFPPHPPQPDLLVGPFTTYKVVVEGRAIPLLTGHPQDNGDITLIVDGRFMIDLPQEHARQVAWLVAQAIAVAQGYSHLGATRRFDIPFAPEIHKIESDDIR